LIFFLTPPLSLSLRRRGREGFSPEEERGKKGAFRGRERRKQGFHPMGRARD
jgi:hypothetical protein